MTGNPVLHIEYYIPDCGSSVELSRSLSFLGVFGPPGVNGPLVLAVLDALFFRSLEHHFQSGCALKCASFT